MDSSKSGRSKGEQSNNHFENTFFQNQNLIFKIKSENIIIYLNFHFIPELLNLYLVQYPLSKPTSKTFFPGISFLFVCVFLHFFIFCHLPPVLGWVMYEPVFDPFQNHQYLNSCLPVRTGIIRFGSKLSKNKAFTSKHLKGRLVPRVSDVFGSQGILSFSCF